MDFGDHDEFEVEDVEVIVKDAIETTLKSNMYTPKKVNDWANTVVDICLKGLRNLDKRFKYVVTCIIMQKSGAGLHTSATCYWDVRRDGHCRLAWENDTMHCIVTVFGMSINPSEPDMRH
eukprot:PLAT5982.2.p1 GENE.PLAT5982.2~~PLAT5982.2.p1  ORF type:complete len:120 (+),score=45.25 PLAT5982.2:50-409(+)